MGIIFNLNKKIKKYIDYIRFSSNLKKSLKSNPLADEMPWIVYRAFHLLDSIIKPDMRVFEYGMGGSTLYFSKKVMEVISVDNNNEWYQKVSTILAEKKIQNTQIYLKEGVLVSEDLKRNTGNPNDYASFYMKSCQNLSFENYAKTIEQYPDNYFDIVFIDGRARNSCCMHALKKIKKGGYIILDNSERGDYKYIHNSLHSWNSTHFYGMGPYCHVIANRYWQTSFWKK